MSSPPSYVIRYAVAVANTSPCAKSKRGVVIYDRVVMMAHGTNGPPTPFVCTGSATCRWNCPKLCEHAEAAALRNLEGSRVGYQLLHIKTVDGEPVASGGPSCVDCSKAILADGRISGVWLMHEDGWRRYDPVEFHELSAAQNGITLSRLAE
jgi:deoxycytidylate deaminase